MERGGHERSTVLRSRHIYDSQGQILALAFEEESLKPCKLSPLRSKSVLNLPSPSPRWLRSEAPPPNSLEP